MPENSPIQPALSDGEPLLDRGYRPGGFPTMPENLQLGKLISDRKKKPKNLVFFFSDAPHPALDFEHSLAGLSFIWFFSESAPRSPTPPFPGSEISDFPFNNEHMPHSTPGASTMQSRVVTRICAFRRPIVSRKM
jgi:hypothetical protein